MIPGKKAAETAFGTTEPRKGSYDVEQFESVTVWELEPGQRVGCCGCVREGVHVTYSRGQAFLAGPAHLQCDGNADYVCIDHLAEWDVIGSVGASLSRESVEWMRKRGESPLAKSSASGNARQRRASHRAANL